MDDGFDWKLSMDDLDVAYLSKSEFEDLDDNQKWNYIVSLIKIIKELKIQADKNCGECEKHYLDEGDINIDLLFEDWRYCKEMSEDCENCGEEEKRFMCDIQFNLLNHMAEEMNSLRRKLSGLVKAVLRKEDKGKNLIKSMEEGVLAKEKGADAMFQ